MTTEEQRLAILQAAATAKPWSAERQRLTHALMALDGLTLVNARDRIKRFKKTGIVRGAPQFRTPYVKTLTGEQQEMLSQLAGFIADGLVAGLPPIEAVSQGVLRRGKSCEAARAAGKGVGDE